MHTRLTRWTPKAFRLHGRRIVTVVPSALHNADGRNERGQVTGCFSGCFCRLEVSKRVWKTGQKEELTLTPCFGHQGPGREASEGLRVFVVPGGESNT